MKKVIVVIFLFLSVSSFAQRDNIRYVRDRDMPNWFLPYKQFFSAPTPYLGWKYYFEVPNKTIKFGADIDRGAIIYEQDSNTFYRVLTPWTVFNTMHQVFSSGNYIVVAGGGINSHNSTFTRIDTLYISDSIHDLRIENDTLWVNDTAYGYSGDVNKWTQSGDSLYPTTGPSLLYTPSDLSSRTLRLTGGDTLITSLLGKIAYAAGDNRYYVCKNTGAGKKWYPIDNNDYWTQAGGKLYPTTTTDDIVALDSLRVEGASLFKDNFTVTSTNIANVFQIDGTTGQMTVSDSISAWGPTPSYSTKHMIYNSSVELNNGGLITFFPAVHGWGQISGNDGATYAKFRFAVDGTVTLLSDCTVDVDKADTDAKLCIYDLGTQIGIKNRLGTNEGFLIEIHYGSTIFP